MGLFSLHNCMSQFPIINLISHFISISIFISIAPNGSVSLENSEYTIHSYDWILRLPSFESTSEPSE